MATVKNDLGPKGKAIYERLRFQIDRGYFQPGQRLPGIRELSAQYGVSPMVIRHAVNCLARIGVVSVRHGSGIYVRNAIPSSPGSAVISMMYLFDGKGLTTIQRKLLDQGFLLCVYSQTEHRWDPNSEARFLERVRQERHRALLAFCSPLAEKRVAEELRACVAEGVRVIHIEHFREQLPDEEYILPDYRAAGRMAAVELLLGGYQNVVLIQSNPMAPFSRMFGEGVEEAVAIHGGQGGMERVIVGPALLENEELRQALSERVRKSSKGVGFACDHVWIGEQIAETLRRAGWTGPDHFGIIGPSLIGVKEDPPAVDRIVFDRAGMLQMAIEAATGLRGQTVRRLVLPRVERRGSIRTGGPQ